MQSSKPAKIPVKTELLDFYDGFVEFHDNCSFLCDALASLTADHEALDQSTILGVKRHCYWLKDRVQVLKRELNQIQTRLSARSEHSGLAEI